MQNQAQHTSINHGVDFERARGVLNDIAGRAFRQYHVAKQAGKSLEDLSKLRDAYKEALEEYNALKRTDTDRIREILAVHQ